MSALSKGALHGALDLSGAKARFAVAESNGNVVLNCAQPMRQREAANLANFVMNALCQAGIELEEIKFWSIGSGPGSFTGMRMAAALVAGFGFGKNNVAIRCVPTAVAVAECAELLPESVATVLYDGRNSEIIGYELNITPAGAIPANRSFVLNKSQAEFLEFNGRKMIMQKCEAEAILKIAPPTWEITEIEDFDIARLIFAEYKSYDNNFSELEYIRPAVYTTKIDLK